MVVFHHFTLELLPISIYTSFFIRQSWLFVDLFFILSGFVISLNYHTIDNLKSFVNFIKKRFIRLYPLLFFTVITFLIFKLLGTYFFDGVVNSPGTLQENILLTFDTLLFTNATPILGITPGMNHPSWSISSEMISYILYGLILLFVSKKMTTMSFVVVILTSINILFFMGETRLNYTSDFGFLRGFISFFIGVLIYKSYDTDKIPWNNFFEYLSLPMIILCFYLMSNNEFSTNYYFIIPFLLGISILFLTKTNGFVSRILETNILQFLGRISYSVYLNHGLIIILFPRFIFTFLKFEINPISQLIIITASIAFIIFYSNLTYKLIELRCANFLKRFLF